MQEASTAGVQPCDRAATVSWGDAVQSTRRSGVRCAFREWVAGATVVHAISSAWRAMGSRAVGRDLERGASSPYPCGGRALLGQISCQRLRWANPSRKRR